MMNKDEVLKQSKVALEQWGELWANNSKINGEKYRREMRTHQDLLHIGAGRGLLCIGTGPSLEKNIPLLQKYSDTNLDIACNDKTLGTLLDAGIKVDYVFIADASVNYEKYCKPWIDKTEEIVLLSNVNAQTEWADNWKGQTFFYVNKDNIESEKIYMEISGCKEVIPASSNVGNTSIVMSTQLFGYDYYLLTGYDFCWGDNENYYCGEDSEKRHWMKHLHIIDKVGRLVNTSQNLYFSVRWLDDFYKMSSQHGVQMFDCSGQGLCSIPSKNLEKELKNATVRALKEDEKNEIMQRRMKSITIDSAGGKDKLNEVLNSVNVAKVVVNYIPDEVVSWLKV